MMMIKLRVGTNAPLAIRFFSPIKLWEVIGLATRRSRVVFGR
jgi:hypothetical protein